MFGDGSPLPHAADCDRIKRMCPRAIRSVEIWRRGQDNEIDIRIRPRDTPCPRPDQEQRPNVWSRCDPVRCLLYDPLNLGSPCARGQMSRTIDSVPPMRRVSVEVDGTQSSHLQPAHRNSSYSLSKAYIGSKAHPLFSHGSTPPQDGPLSSGKVVSTPITVSWTLLSTIV